MGRFCIVEDDQRVRTVTINRPEVMNALYSEAHEELASVWDDFAANDELWVAIITGAGDRSFCAGNDLKIHAAGKNGPFPPTGFAGLTRRYDLDKPVIAAVNGYALGGGFEIALACDIIVASENATFALSEPRVGLIAQQGGIHRLARCIPQKLALELVLTGRRVTATEGESMGFLNRVVPVGQVLSEARRLAGLINECSPKAIRAAKQTFFQGMGEKDLAQAIDNVYPAQLQNMASQDYIEGPKAFAEKRPPIWRNS